MKFIVIEGLDGSGKSTQLKLLKDSFKEQNINYEFLHFPRVETPWYGELVAMFLRGDFGDINNVNPYLVATIYAGDRLSAKEKIEEWLEEDKLVLVDRYVLSNIAFQCAKIDNQADKEKLAEWIFKFEFEYNKIPKPDLNIFLDVPFEFTVNNLEEERTGDDRDYLKGQKDIHEKSMDFQSEVRKVYLDQIKRNKNFIKLDCYNSDNKILPPQDVFEKIKKCLNDNSILT